MRSKTASCVATALCVVVSLAGSARGGSIVLALTGESAPSGPLVAGEPNGFYLTFKHAPVLNHFGQIAFRADLEASFYGEVGNTGVFRVDSEEGTVIVQAGMPLPSWLERFRSFYSPAINNLGQVAFWADNFGYGQTGIYCGTGDAVPTQIVREYEPSPDGNGRFDEISKYVLRPLDIMGNVAFRASFRDTDGGAADDTGIVLTLGSVPRVVAREDSPSQIAIGAGDYMSFPSEHVALSRSSQVAFWASIDFPSWDHPVNGIISGRSPLYLLAYEGMPAPGGGYLSVIDRQPSIWQGHPDDPPSVAFLAFLENTPGGPGDDDIALYHGSNPLAIYEIARRGNSPPDCNGQYDLFGAEVSQGDDAAAFHVSMRNTSNPGIDNDGIYRSDFDGQTIKIARGGEPAPGGNGVLYTLYQPVMNRGGQVAFQAMLWDTAGGVNDNQAIYIGDGLILVEVARTGNALLGSTITGLHFATGPNTLNGFNSHCQVAYKANLADGRQALVLVTPLVEWIGGASGEWSDKDNWTLGIAATEVHDVVIAPGHSVEVAGPRTYATIKSLTLGTPDGGAATLTLTGAGDLTALGEVAIGPNGLILVGAGRALTAGALLNQGTLAFEAGQGHVLGDVTNGPGGQILVPAGANAWIHGPLANTGVVEVAPGGEVHLLGLTGNGPTGAGTTWLEGDVRPGQYIGQMGFEGDVVLGRGCVMHMELGGPSPGCGHDKLNIGGAASLGGTLAISLINNFTPQVGDEFEIMTYASRTGEFAETTGWLFDGNKALVKVYGANALTLFATYQGDATLDYCVDGLDYVAWSSNYLTGDTWQEGDFNGDGIADGLDYIVWSTNYEQGCPGSPGSIPEPGALSLLALGLLGFRRRSRA